MLFRDVMRVFAAGILTLTVASTGWAETSNVPYVDISPSVVLAQNEDGSNLTCIALEDGLAFVDTGLITETAARFRKAMETRFERPTRYLFLTHGHLDHLFAMGAFADVEVVAAAAERPLIERQLAIEFDEAKTAAYTGIFPAFGEAVESAAPFAPTIWVEGERQFGSDDKKLIYAPAGGHTDGSSYLWLPSEGVLVTGDLVQVDKYPYFGDPSNDLAEWIDSLKGWHALEPTAICPGHGRPVDRDYLRLEWEYFEGLIAALSTLKAEGVPVQQAVVHRSLPVGYWPEQSEPRWWTYGIAQLYKAL